MAEITFDTIHIHEQQLELFKNIIEEPYIVKVRQNDKITSPILGYFAKQLTYNGSLIDTTLAQPTSINSPTITVANASLLNVNDYIAIFPSTTIGLGNFFFGLIKIKNGNILTLDRLLDYSYIIGDFVFPVRINMNVNGSLSTPQIFVIQAGAPGTNINYTIKEIIIQMITTGSPEFSDFGDITNGLANGCTLRVSNIAGDVVRNIFNIKTNAEMDNLFYDIKFLDPTFPQAVNGVTCRIKFDDKSTFGVPIRLLAGERIEFIISDNLTSLLSFKITAKGNIFEI